MSQSNLSQSKPRLLDLFCGAGGCTKGYQRAGFHVTGVDVKPQQRYVGDDFIQADAMQFLEDGFLIDPRRESLTYRLREFDAIHASPPCQRYTMAQNAAQNAEAHPDLVEPVRDALEATGLPYVIENVVGAPLRNHVTLCGLAFGLNVKRHRLFETNFPVLAPPCPSHDRDYYVIFGHEVRSRRHGQAAGRKNSRAEGRKAMDIDWMTRGELSEAIPPAMTEHIGHYLLAEINARQEAKAA